MPSEMSYMQDLKESNCQKERIIRQLHKSEHFSSTMSLTSFLPFLPTFFFCDLQHRGLEAEATPVLGDVMNQKPNPEVAVSTVCKLSPCRKNWGWALVCPVLALGEQGRNTPFFCQSPVRIFLSARPTSYQNQVVWDKPASVIFLSIIIL